MRTHDGAEHVSGCARSGSAVTAAAVVVTFNRIKELGRCLEAVLHQTRRPDVVLVVDNGSTDGTGDWVRAHFNEPVRLLQLPANRGGAGGFAAGLKAAYDGGWDWIWLMDDDGVPADHALEELLRAAECRAAPAVFNSAVVDNEDPGALTFGVWESDEQGRPRRLISDYSSLVRAAGATREFPGWGCFFNGTLLPRRVVETVGLPDARLFIRGDEVDFHFRVQRRYAIWTVVSSRHFHPTPRGTLSGVKLYYAHRNSLINERRHCCAGPWEKALFTGRMLLRVSWHSARLLARPGSRDRRAKALGSFDALFGLLSRRHRTVVRVCG